MKSTSNDAANELSMAISIHDSKQNGPNMETTQLDSIDSDEITIVYANPSNTIAETKYSDELDQHENRTHSISMQINADINNVENEIISEHEQNMEHIAGPLKHNCILPKKTAVLFIEYQNDFAHEEGKLYEAVEPELIRQDMLSKSKVLLDHARDREFVIIHAPITYCADHEKNANIYGILYNVATKEAFKNKKWGADYYESMRPGENEFIVKGKHGLDTFVGTDLDDILQSENIENLVICGFLTNCCVESTMRTGYEYGYNVITIHDCCAATSQQEHENSVNYTFKMFSIPITCEQFITASCIETVSNYETLAPSSVMHSRQKYEYLKLTKDIAESMVARSVSLIVIFQLLMDTDTTNIAIKLEIAFLYIIAIGDIITTVLFFTMWCYCHDRSKFENEDSWLPHKYRIQRAAELRFVFRKFAQIISVMDVLKITLCVSIGIKSFSVSLIYTIVTGILELSHIIFKKMYLKNHRGRYNYKKKIDKSDTIIEHNADYIEEIVFNDTTQLPNIEEKSSNITNSPIHIIDEQLADVVTEIETTSVIDSMMYYLAGETKHASNLGILGNSYQPRTHGGGKQGKNSSSGASNNSSGNNSNSNAGGSSSSGSASSTGGGNGCGGDGNGRRDRGNDEHKKKGDSDHNGKTDPKSTDEKIKDEEDEEEEEKKKQECNQSNEEKNAFTLNPLAQKFELNGPILSGSSTDFLSMPPINENSCDIMTSFLQSTPMLISSQFHVEKSAICNTSASVSAPNVSILEDNYMHYKSVSKGYQNLKNMKLLMNEFINEMTNFTLNCKNEPSIQEMMAELHHGVQKCNSFIKRSVKCFNDEQRFNNPMKNRSKWENQIKCQVIAHIAASKASKSKLPQMYIRLNNQPNFQAIDAPSSKVHISGKLIQEIRNKTKRIFKYNRDIRNFMNSYIAIQAEWKEDRISMDFGFIDKNTHENLYCEIVKEKYNGYEWKMKEILFTSNTLSNTLSLTLNSNESVKAKLSIQKWLEKCEWKKVPIFNRKNNKIRIRATITREQLIFQAKHLSENNMNLLPIVSNHPHSSIAIDFVVIIMIHKYIYIGISLDLQNERINGVYADKDYLLQRHYLVNPQHMNECQCLDAYEFIVHDVQIGNPDFWFNKAKDYEKKLNIISTPSTTSIQSL